MLTVRCALLTVLLTLLSLTSSACGDNSPGPLPAHTPQAPRDAPAVSPDTKDQAFLVALASTDLAVGENRLSFGVIRRGEGPIKDAEVQLQTFRITDDGPQGPTQTIRASFRSWPGGSGGVYVAQVSFDQAGNWGIGVLLTQPDRSVVRANTRVQVREQSMTPAIGAPAIRSANKTSKDVPSLDELTTDTEPDPGLYSMTIAEALGQNRPLLVTFASPAYCQTMTCGPQVDVVKNLKSSRSGDMNFLHIEVYDNPKEIQGDLTRGRISPTLKEWGLPTEPWTFVMDSEGLVQAKFEGFVGRDDLEAAIQGVLE